MKYKTVIYHPFNRINLNFTEENFRSLLKQISNMQIQYANNESEFYDYIKDSDFIVALKVDNNIYKEAYNLKAIFTCMAGRDAIPEPVGKNIRRYYGSFHGKLIRESLLSAMLCFNQRILELRKYQENNEWANAQLYGDRTLIDTQSVAIFGYGAIGEYCANYLNNIGIKNIYAIQRTHRNGLCKNSQAKYIHISEVDKILKSVDHVVSFLPESKETNNIFDMNFFSKMNQNACFYNFGRGNSVIETDLAMALQNNLIYGAYLDVFRDEPLPKESILWGVKNLIITPHISTYYKSYFSEYGFELFSQMQNEIYHLESNEV